MSRIGREPIPLPSGVEVSIGSDRVQVKGPKGSLSMKVARGVTVDQDNGTLHVKRQSDRGPHRALHGLTRSLVANMVQGVTQGFERRLDISGVGYRASLKGANLEVLAGYSHPVIVEPRADITFEVPAPTQIIVKGMDKQVVGEVAANIRSIRPPEPYKGKGIRYSDEVIVRKVGKRA